MKHKCKLNPWCNAQALKHPFYLNFPVSVIVIATWVFNIAVWIKPCLEASHAQYKIILHIF